MQIMASVIVSVTFGAKWRSHAKQVEYAQHSRGRLSIAREQQH